MHIILSVTADSRSAPGHFPVTRIKDCVENDTRYWIMEGVSAGQESDFSLEYCAFVVKPVLTYRFRHILFI
jgi:hypothetical protein